MTWTVLVTGKAKKQAEQLPARVQTALNVLMLEIRSSGPVRGNWYHYGKLQGMPGFHHCHLNKGKPRYVAVWKESEKSIQLVEVRYVGTHEKAPY
ncbi:MAG: cytotoxic translational repressor of toxin-antitoxin stability system [Desulfomicrobium sp.]|nr:cytotoxic translational repressor of toxin-antitoxin stability system [Desulfomicrobium sp.]